MMGLIQHGDQAFVDDASHRVHCGTCYREEIDRLRAENEALRKHNTGMIAEVKMLVENVNRINAENAALRELCQRAYENLDDDIENKPMRHSCGKLIANLRAALAGKFDWRKS